MANNYNSTLQANNSALQAILNTINELPSGRGVFKSGILTGAATYGAVGEYYYYYDLSEFNDKVLLCLIQKIGSTDPDVSIIAKQNTSNSFELIASTEAVVSPSIIEGNVLKSGSASYYYYTA